MNTQEMIDGLREYVAVQHLQNATILAREKLSPQQESRCSAAEMWIFNYASAIADEMERLGAENEKMRKALTSANTHMRDDSHLRRFPVTWALIDSALDAKGGG